MGLLIDGQWHIDDPAPSADGRYRRTVSTLRNWITPSGEAGHTGRSGFAPERGRYHLVVAMTCPWAHRAVIVRKLKKLEDFVALSYVAPRRSDQGWIFDLGDWRDELFGCESLHEHYTRSESDFSGRVTVPILWDLESSRIVSNESADIIRMFNDAFVDVAEPTPDLYPAAKREKIDAWNDRIYRDVNNGVYRTGFASTQAAYDEAVTALFKALDEADRQLGESRYLVGDDATEADWRFFPTLARFDSAYNGAFKCNLRRIADYENLWPYTRDLFQTPDIAETIDLETCKRGYYSLSAERNPLGIVPAGPILDFSAAHQRG